MDKEKVKITTRECRANYKRRISNLSPGSMTKHFNMFFTAEQYLAINKIALYESVSMAAIVRIAVNTYLRMRRMPK
jgi:hypothetical protein